MKSGRHWLNILASLAVQFNYFIHLSVSFSTASVLRCIQLLFSILPPALAGWQGGPLPPTLLLNLISLITEELRELAARDKMATTEPLLTEVPSSLKQLAR